MKVKVDRERMTVDLIVWRALGTQEDGVVEQTLAMNPGLAALGVFLPVGTELELPEPRPAVKRLETVRLWD